LTKVASLEPDVPDGFAHWISRHLEWMRVRNYSPATVKSAEDWLVGFASWCAVRAISRPREVTKPILERYRRHLYHYRKSNGRPLTFGSQRSRLAPLKLFFAWMTRQNALLWNPASELDLPRAEKRLPRALTLEEIEKVIAHAPVSEPLGLRDRAIMETLYSTGMRRNELAHLKLADFISTQRTVFIRQGKGKKDRLVPIGERAVAWVNKYLLDVRPLFVVDDVEDALFVSELGTAFRPDSLSMRIRRYVQAAKLGQNGSCHLFRHTMATLMLEGGADVRFIQEMLGHANLQTTQIYTHVSIQKLKAIHDATHPGAKLKPVASRAADVKTEAERVALLQALDAEPEEDQA
jgi:integrase/recombinase XerD